MIDSIFHFYVLLKRNLITLLIVFLFLGRFSTTAAEVLHLENKIRQIITSEDIYSLQEDCACPEDRKYRVYMIDNFEQGVELVPEVLTSHGEMLVKILMTGRNDIELITMNTALSKGLRQVLRDLIAGECVDAVVSSVPGSNYAYGQISTLLPGRPNIDSENILDYRDDLRNLLGDIAFGSLPSVEWLEKIDVNLAKLRNDARKFIYIEALGRFNVPVILPYGNPDTLYKGQIKTVNLLSLASNALAYSALDQKGDRVEGFPYSPLSSGDERAFYNIVECPHSDDPFKAVLDINNDGYSDYTYFRSDQIAYHDDHGELAFAPPVLKQHQFVQWLAKVENCPECLFNFEVVLTAAQYSEIKWLYSIDMDIQTRKDYVWLNSSEHGPFYAFNPACWRRGTLIGTSLIPPCKLREILTPKNDLVSGENIGKILSFLDR
ncbi:MAG: hypothetical protein PVG19_12315 [Desulfobacterales bacterium]|jgi:hypothetical protein